MTCWEVLGIEKTADKKQIVAAYRSLLTKTNPEDDQAGFMALRAAYEQALAEAAGAAPAEEKPKTPVECWMQKVEEVYNDFGRRRDAECWRRLLEDDVCVALDKKLEARNALLRFFLQKYFITRQVWALLDARFDLEESKEELFDAFPRDFVEYVILNGIRYDTTVPYDLFELGAPGDAYDSYIKCYSQANRLIREGKHEEAQAMIDQMAQGPARHPYTDLLRVRLDMNRDRLEECRPLADEIFSRWPADQEIGLIHADLYRLLGEETAAGEYEALLALYPDRVAVKYGLAICLTAKGEYKRAKDLYIELSRQLPYDQNITRQINLVNESYMTQLEEKCKQDPDDTDSAIELGWCWLQNDHIPDAMALTATINAEKADAYDYHNLCGKLYLHAMDPHKALPHLQKWEEAILALPVIEGDKENARKRSRLTEAVSLQASALSMLKKPDEALVQVERAIALDPQKPEPYENKARLTFNEKNYEETLRTTEALLSIAPDSFPGHYFRALAFFEMDYFQDAFGEFSAANQANPSDLGCYIYKARILLIYDKWDDAREIVEFLERSNVQADSLRYCKARLLAAEKQEEEALRIYAELLDNIGRGDSDIDFGYEIYYQSALLGENREKVEDQIKLLDMALEERSDYHAALSYKAYLLRKNKQFKEAIGVYELIMKKYPHHRSANGRIAQIYYDDLLDYAAALEYYKRQAKAEDSAHYQEMIGLCHGFLHEYPEAESYIRRSIEMEPDRLRAYSNLALTMEEQFRFAESEKVLFAGLDAARQFEKDERGMQRGLIRLYRRMGNYAKAVGICKELIGKYDELGDYRLMFDIHQQAGDWQQARLWLSNWKEKGGDKVTQADYDRILAEVTLCEGDLKETLRLRTAVGTRRNSDLRNLAMVLYYMEKYAEASKKLAGHTDPDCLPWAARIAWHTKDKKEAARLAELALAQAENYSRQKWREPFYLTKKAEALILLGRYEEARVLLERALKTPLCEACTLGVCKDAKIGFAQLAEAMGDKETARKLYEEGADLWPDEADFIYGAKRMSKKGFFKW